MQVGAQPQQQYTACNTSHKNKKVMSVPRVHNKAAPSTKVDAVPAYAQWLNAYYYY